MGERGVDVIGTKFLMGDHLYSEGTGLLLAGVAVFVVLVVLVPVLALVAVVVVVAVVVLSW